MNATPSISREGSLSEAKRKLLGKLVLGHAHQTQGSQPSICSRSPETPVPLSLAQEQIWSALRASPAACPLYNEFITIHHHGPMNVRALQRSLTEIVRRHEAWRTTFHASGEHALQIVAAPPEQVPLAVVDLRLSSNADGEREAALVAAAEASKPFDLARGPLLRATLIQLPGEDHRLHLAFHQLIVDGLSVFRILPLELVTLYNSFAAGQPSPLPELPVQFGDFACWQRKWFSNEVLNRQLSYWRTHLADCPSRLNWPKEGSRPSAQTFRGAIYPKTISSKVADAIRRTSQQHGVTLFMALLAGFAALLHLYSEQDDIVIGTLTPAGRHRPEVQDLLGYFMNPLPLRLRLHGNPTFQQLLLQTREITSAALTNDDVPLHYLTRELQPALDASRHPFFQVALSLAPELPDLGSGWHQTFMDFASGAARWDLYLEFNQRPDGLVLRAQYNPDIFSVAAIEKAVNDLEALLDAAARDVSIPMSQLRMCLQ